MALQPEIPNDRYKAGVLAELAEQTRLLRQIAANSEAQDGRLDQLQSRSNQILARCTATADLVAGAERVGGSVRLPNIFAGQPAREEQDVTKR